MKYGVEQLLRTIYIKAKDMPGITDKSLLWAKTFTQLFTRIGDNSGEKCISWSKTLAYMYFKRQNMAYLRQALSM